MKKLGILGLILWATAAWAQNVPDANLFAAGWNNVSATNPNVPIWCPTDSSSTIVPLSGFRVWDDGMKWSQIETSNGSYTWTILDKVINTLRPNATCPVHVLYQFGATPAFAAASGTATACANPDTTNSCRPPSDLNGDGTGADSFWLNFVGNLVNRYSGKIAYYGIWNEADSSNFWCWNGTACGGGSSGASAPNVPSLNNLVLMAWDAKKWINCVDPSAKMISPDGHVGTMTTWFHNYVNTSITAPARSLTIAGHTCSWSSQTVTGKDTFDIVDEHMRGTSSNNNDPTQVIAAYNAAASEMTTDSLLTLPLWNDEYGYVGSSQAANTQIQAGYVAVQLALMSSFTSPNISQSYWYEWDSNQGPLQGTVVGLAYRTAEGWLSGSSVNTNTKVGTIYSITGTTAASVPFKITFDTSKTCTSSSMSSCTTSTQTETGYTQYVDVAGNAHSISGTAPVGWQPIFLTGSAATPAATPTCSPNGGTFASNQTATCSTTSPGAIICYTLNGTTPATNGTTGCTTGTLYSTSISITVNLTLKAIAGGTGFTDSSVFTSSAFVFHGSAPTFSPAAGTYNGSQTVTITDPQSLSMCYTTDGSSPTSTGTGSCSHGTAYTVPLVISSTETLKAIGYKNGWTDSTIGSAAYSINYNLAVTVSGLGTISSSPIGITSCSATGGTCSALFGQGTAITLTATAGPGYSFAGWSGGGCSGTSTCVVTLNSATSTTATFSMVVPQASSGLHLGVTF